MLKTLKNLSALLLAAMFSHLGRGEVPINADALYTSMGFQISLAVDGSPFRQVHTLQLWDSPQSTAVIAIKRNSRSSIKVKADKPIPAGEGFVIRFHRAGAPISHLFGAGDGKTAEWNLNLLPESSGLPPAVMFFDKTPGNTTFVLITAGDNSSFVTGAVAKNSWKTSLPGGKILFYITPQAPKSGIVHFSMLRPRDEKATDAFKNQLIIASPGKRPINVESPPIDKSSRAGIVLKDGKAKAFAQSKESDPNLATGANKAAREYVKKLSAHFQDKFQEKPSKAVFKKLVDAATSAYYDALTTSGPIMGGGELLLANSLEWLGSGADRLAKAETVVIRRDKDHLVVFYEKGLVDENFLASQLSFGKFYVRVKAVKGKFIASSEFDKVL